MEELLKKIDNLILDIQTDTNRTKLPELGINLVELSKKLAEYKKDYIIKKSAYEREFVMKKEQRKTYLDDRAEKKLQEELESNPKAKKDKITNVEIEQSVELELLTIKREVAELQSEVAYMETIIKSYYELINMWKYLDKSTIQGEKFYGFNG